MFVCYIVGKNPEWTFWPNQYMYSMLMYHSLFLTVLEAGKSKIKAPADLIFDESPFLIHRCLSFFCKLTGWKGQRWLSQASFIRSLIPFMSALPSSPCHFSKSLSRVGLFATPWTVAYHSPLSMGFFQARVLEWVAICFAGGSSPPRY